MKLTLTEFIVIDNINTFEGEIPNGYDLIITENGDTENGLILYGFDEVGLYDNTMKNPVYGFIRNLN